MFASPYQLTRSPNPKWRLFLKNGKVIGAFQRNYGGVYVAAKYFGV